MLQSIDPKQSRCNRSRKATRECLRCRYALYLATGRCSNEECPKFYGDRSTLTAEQASHQYDRIPLFHGRRWGQWVLDTERLCLVYRGEPSEVGGKSSGVPTYVAYLGHYEVDIELIRQSSVMLDWIFQINGKGWATARVIKDLINAFDDIFQVQESLCSFGTNKVIEQPGKFLRHRIATVDVPSKDAA